MYSEKGNGFKDLKIIAEYILSGILFSDETTGVYNKTPKFQPIVENPPKHFHPNRGIFKSLLIISDHFDNEAKTSREKNLFSKVQFDLSILPSINKLIDSAYARLFRVYRMSSTHTAAEYLAGLLQVSLLIFETGTKSIRIFIVMPVYGYRLSLLKDFSKLK